MTEPMRALTVRPPWSQAIAHGTKRVENRTRPAPKLAVGGLIAIHAGKSFDWDATFPPSHMAEWAAPEDCVLGAVVAVALLDGCHWPAVPDPGVHSGRARVLVTGTVLGLGYAG